MSEMRVGIRELKAHLSEYLRKVKAGGTVVITERGKPMGQILPLGETLEEKMQRLQDEGFLTWSGKKLEPRQPSVVNTWGRKMSDLIIEDRDIDYLP